MQCLKLFFFKKRFLTLKKNNNYMLLKDIHFEYKNRRSLNIKFKMSLKIQADTNENKRGAICYHQSCRP